MENENEDYWIVRTAIHFDIKPEEVTMSQLTLVRNMFELEEKTVHPSVGLERRMEEGKFDASAIGYGLEDKNEKLSQRVFNKYANPLCTEYWSVKRVLSGDSATLVASQEDWRNIFIKGIVRSLASSFVPTKVVTTRSKTFREVMAHMLMNEKCKGELSLEEIIKVLALLDNEVDDLTEEDKTKYKKYVPILRTLIWSVKFVSPDPWHIESFDDVSCVVLDDLFVGTDVYTHMGYVNQIHKWVRAGKIVLISDDNANRLKPVVDEVFTIPSTWSTDTFELYHQDPSGELEGTLIAKLSLGLNGLVERND